MGHAAGQLADGLHLLGLGELDLDLLLLGDVDEVGDPAAVAAGEVEVGDPRRIVGQPHFQWRLRFGMALGGVGAARGLQQFAERLADLAGLGDRLQRRVGLDDPGVERVHALQQRRAERRGGGEGVQHLGRRRLGAGHGVQDLQGRGRQRQDAASRPVEPDQEAARVEARDQGLVVLAAGLQGRAAEVAAARGGQGGEQAGSGGRALGQARAGAHRLAPGLVAAQQAAVGGGDGGGFVEGGQEGLGGPLRLGRGLRRRAQDEHAQAADAGQADQQHDAGERLRTLVDRRHSGEREGE